MNLKQLATRLRKVREEHGASQQAVAEALALSRTAITQMEAGNRSISTVELSKLAKFYRCSISSLLEEKNDSSEDIVFLYRALEHVSKDQETKKQINHYVDLCKAGTILEKILGYDSLLHTPKYNVAFPQSKAEATNQAENIAAQERKRLDIGVEPIADIPSLIANQGIWVVAAELPESISGLSFSHIQTGRVVLVNIHHPKVRKRFSYAHEYAHILLDCDGPLMVSKKENHNELVEIRANAFAAAFLMPSDGVTKFLRQINKGQPGRQTQVIFDVATNGHVTTENRISATSQNITYLDVAKMAHHFGVSYQAAAYRLRSLNFVSAADENDLINKYAAGKKLLDTLNLFSEGVGKEDENLDDRKFVNKITYFVVEAYRRHEISRGRVIELGDQIGIGGKKLFDLADTN